MKTAVFSFLTLALLTGCLSTYKPAEGGPTARIKPVGYPATATICIDDEASRLSSDRSGFASIPAGQEVRLGAQYQESTGAVSFTCIPVAKFVPEEGASYIQKFQQKGRACSVEIYREANGAEELVAESSPDSFGCAARQ
ncbi:MAG: hypothetical protein NT046_00310 [Arenimonas sp.]|nr:hypothetical protein [Arenimonas sp.]